MPSLASPPVVSIRALRVQVPLWTPFTISCGGMDSADNILLFATDAEGRVGVGEAAPFPVLTHDDAARSLALCNTLGPELCGRTPDAALRRLTEELWPEAANESITACVGIELALWDLLAQQHSLSLSELWRQQRGEGVVPVPAFDAATESTKPTGAAPSVWTDITLPIMDPSSVRTFWSRFAAHGFPYIKVKVGSGSVAEDVDRILQFQRDCVPSARFSVDGNQAYQIDSALQLLQRLEQAGITPLLFEQPLPADDWEGMIRAHRAVASSHLCRRDRNYLEAGQATASRAGCTHAESKVYEKRCARDAGHYRASKKGAATDANRRHGRERSRHDSVPACSVQYVSDCLL
jgi:L-alanine-DL-glutamate epimerase-like enolase superfamily enzyme